MVWTVIRVALVLLALVTLFLTPVFAQGPSGTQILIEGAVIGLIAVAVLVASGWSLWRSRRA